MFPCTGGIRISSRNRRICRAMVGKSIRAGGPVNSLRGALGTLHCGTGASVRRRNVGALCLAFNVLG